MRLLPYERKRVAFVYATALYETAKGFGFSQKCFEALQIWEIAIQEEGVRFYLHSGTVQLSKKVTFLHKLLSQDIHSGTLHTLLDAFLSIIILTKKRWMLLKEIANAFQHLLMREAKGEVIQFFFPSKVGSAGIPLADLQKSIDVGTVSVSCYEQHLDPTLIAGGVLQMQDRRIDFSMKRRLAQLLQGLRSEDAAFLAFRET